MPRKVSPRKAPSRKKAAPAKHAILKIDGHDDELIGMVTSFGGEKPVLVYDAEAIIQKLQDRDGMTEEEAAEFFDVNIAGSYMGSGTPLLLGRKPDGMDLDDWVDLLNEGCE